MICDNHLGTLYNYTVLSKFVGPVGQSDIFYERPKKNVSVPDQMSGRKWFLKSVWRHSVTDYYNKVRNTPYFVPWHLGDKLGVYPWPQCKHKKRFYKSHSKLSNIVAAFRGMHVSPAKHSYAWLSRKCDYRTDRHTHTQTDAGQSDPYVPLCFVISIYVHGDLDLWPLKSIGSILSPWLTCLPSLIKKYTMVWYLSCSQAYFHVCQLWPWPLTSDLQNQ